MSEEIMPPANPRARRPSKRLALTRTVGPAAKGTLVTLTPGQMVQAAVQAGQWDAVDKLLELQERVEKRNALKAFNDAISIAKSKIEPIVKDKHVFFESKQPGGRATDYWYEDLASIAKAVDPILSEVGLSYRFRTHTAPNEPITVTCIIAHRDGHSEENSLPGPRDDTGNKNSIQQVGSTITYLQRYTLKAALGLSAEKDDDALSTGTAIANPISDEQNEQLQQLIVEVAQDIPRFCAHYEIEKVRDLPRDRFADAISFLKRKRERQSKKEQDDHAAEHA